MLVSGDLLLLYCWCWCWAIDALADGVDHDMGELFAAAGADSDCRAGADMVCRAVAGAIRGFCLQTSSSCWSWSGFVDSFCRQAVAVAVVASAAANINHDVFVYSTPFVSILVSRLCIQYWRAGDRRIPFVDKQ